MFFLRVYFIVLSIVSLPSIGIESCKKASPAAPSNRGLAQKKVVDDVSKPLIKEPKGDREEAADLYRALEASKEDMYIYHGDMSDDENIADIEEDKSTPFEYVSMGESSITPMYIDNHFQSQAAEKLSAENPKAVRYQDLDQDSKNHVKEMYLLEKEAQAKELLKSSRYMQDAYRKLDEFNKKTELEYDEQIKRLYDQLDPPHQLEIQAVQEFLMSRQAEYTFRKEKLDLELEKRIFQSYVALLFIEYTVHYTLSLLDVTGYDELNICLKDIGYPSTSLWY